MEIFSKTREHLESVKELTVLLKNHLLAFILALFLLTFLFSSLIPFLAVLAFVIILLYVAHELHFNRHIYETYEVFGMFSVFAVILFFFFNIFYDLLTLTILIVYIISLLISLYLYVHHQQREHFTKIMISCFYAHALAAAAAVITTTGLTWLFLPKSFVNFWYVLAFIVLPVATVYFFATQFFYLYFFDRKHIRIDLSRAVKHATVYASVTLIVLICGFVVTSSLLFSFQKNTILDIIDSTTSEASSVIARQTQEDETRARFWELSVVQELLQYMSSQQTSLDDLRTKTLKTKFSVLGLLKDETYSSLTSVRVKTDVTTIFLHDALDTFERAQASSDSLVQSFGTGVGTENETAFALQLDEFVRARRKFIREGFVEGSASLTTRFLEGKIHLQDPSYEQQFGDGALLNYAYAHGLAYVSPQLWPSSHSIFVRNTEAFIQHTRLFQQAIILRSGAHVAEDHKKEYAPVLGLLIREWGTLETPLSEAVRLDLIMQRVE